MLALSLTLIATPAQAIDLTDDLQVHGFASQGYLHSSANNFFGDSQDNGSFQLREVGVNGSWLITPDLQLSAQVLSRRAGETDKGKLRLDYGFLDYTFLADADYNWGVRLGRTMNPYGLYNDTRDVAFTRPSILLPQSIYFDANRNLALSSDSLQLHGEQRAEIGDFFLQISAARPRVRDPDLERAIFFMDAPGALEPEFSVLGRLIYEQDGGKIRLALTASELNIRYNRRRSRDPFQAGNFSFRPVIASIQYNAERWSLTGEYAWRYVKFEDFGPFLPDTTFIGESYYLQGTYRLAPDWEALVRYDVLYWDRDDRDGKTFAASTRLPAHSRFAKDLTVGLRWDVTPDIMLRTELHHVDGTGWISELENPGRLNTERSWNLFMFMASYRF